MIPVAVMPMSAIAQMLHAASCHAQSRANSPSGAGRTNFGLICRPEYRPTTSARSFGEEQRQRRKDGEADQHADRRQRRSDQEQRQRPRVHQRQRQIFGIVGRAVIGLGVMLVVHALRT